MESREPNKVSESVRKHKLSGVCVGVGIDNPPQQLRQPIWGLDTHMDTNTQEFCLQATEIELAQCPLGHCATFCPPLLPVRSALKSKAEPHQRDLLA